MASLLGPGYEVTTKYGKRGSMWSCNKDVNGNGIHTGDDWAAPRGTPILAPIAGQIRHRNYGERVFGPYQFAISPDPGEPFGDGEVFIAHGLTRLPDGTRVTIGQRISAVGNLGNATGYHAHAEYMPHTKNVWRCGVHADPTPVWAYKGALVVPAPPTSSGGPYITDQISSDKLGMGEPTNGDAWSDTVKELQERLNRIKLAAGATLVVDGKYGPSTDAEVRKWQEQICLDHPDPALKSYLGPSQRLRMFPAPPYVVHNRGLPAIAGGSSSNPPPDGGGGVPPATAPSLPSAPALMLPGAVWDPVKKAGGGWFEGLRAFTGTAKKLTLHTTETSVKPNWTAQQSGLPHLTINLISKESWQHLQFDTSAYTLEGGEHSPNSESGVNIQIEIIGYAAQSAGWSDDEYDELQRILLWLSVKLDIPYVFPVKFPPHHRLSWAEWEPMSGILGHSMVPWNDHSDPGALDVIRLTESPIVPEPPVEPEPPIEIVSGADKKLRATLVVALRMLADDIEALE